VNPASYENNKKKVYYNVLLPFLFVGVLVYPLVFHSPFLQHVMMMIFLFATIAGGWNIISGYCGQISLGHVAFFGIGAYSSTILVLKLGLSPWIGMIVGVGLGIVLATISAYPCFKLKGHYFVIATWAIGEIFQTIALNWDWVGGACGLYVPMLQESFFNFEFHSSKLPYYYISLGMTIGVVTLNYAIERSRLGYYFRAIKADPTAARSSGINLTKYKLIALLLAVTPTSIAGTFYAQYLLFIDPETVLNILTSVLMIVIVMIGGIGTAWGPLLGAAVLIPLSEFTRVYLSGTAGALDLLIYGIMIVLIAEYEPMGIVGLIERFRGRR
jgi:branched-chain amino acid transport system permease protein